MRLEVLEVLINMSAQSKEEDGSVQPFHAPIIVHSGQRVRPAEVLGRLLQPGELILFLKKHADGKFEWKTTYNDKQKTLLLNTFSLKQEFLEDARGDRLVLQDMAARRLAASGATAAWSEENVRSTPASKNDLALASSSADNRMQEVGKALEELKIEKEVQPSGLAIPKPCEHENVRGATASTAGASSVGPGDCILSGPSGGPTVTAVQPDRRRGVDNVPGPPPGPPPSPRPVPPPPPPPAPAPAAALVACTANACTATAFHAFLSHDGVPFKRGPPVNCGFTRRVCADDMTADPQNQQPISSFVQFLDATLFKNNMTNWVDPNDYYNGGLQGTFFRLFRNLDIQVIATHSGANRGCVLTCHCCQPPVTVGIHYHKKASEEELQACRNTLFAFFKYPPQPAVQPMVCQADFWQQFVVPPQQPMKEIHNV
jgi:hypothetical protein